MIRLGRYELFDVLASGGMASVYMGRLRGDDQFARVVAIKRLHPHFARDPELTTMLRDEARMASRIRHPNVVPVTDIVAAGGELSLVMDYVPGESLARLAKSARMPSAIASSIMLGVLAGLHAAHEARDETGGALDLVHRDVSPHNVLVGTDGLAHVIDFGIAKARGRSSLTRDGDLKGKLAYMAPEQIRREEVSRLTDIYAASATLWELLVGRRLVEADDEAGLIVQVLMGAADPPSRFATDLSPEVDAMVMRGLAREPARRYPTARAMAEALEQAIPPAPPIEVTAWVEAHAHDALSERARAMEAAERAGPVLALPIAEVILASSTARHTSRHVAFIALAVVVFASIVGGVGAYARARPRAVEAHAPAPADEDAATVAPTVVTADPIPPGSVAANPRGTTLVSPPSHVRARPTSSKVGCDPPYTIENGHKVFKRPCL